MHAGVIGLMDAIGKYDASKETKFRTYAEFRVRGAMLDEIRSMDWIPRSVREKIGILQRAFDDNLFRHNIKIEDIGRDPGAGIN